MIFKGFFLTIFAVSILFGVGKHAFAGGSGGEVSPLTTPGTISLPDTVDFGPVILLDASTLNVTLKNVGTDKMTVVSFTWTNMAEFKVTGPTNYLLRPDSSVTYQATFSPQSHTANNQHQSTVIFQFKDVNSKVSTDTVILIGEDHVPVTADLSIAKNYLAFADSIVTISQVITDSLTGVLNPIRSFTEDIYYNTNILELTGVENGVQTPAPDWLINAPSVTPGIVHITANSIAPLQAPGEILKLVFHVLSQAQTFDTSNFIVDTGFEFDNNPFEPLISSDTGLLRVIDACVPLVGTGIKPTTSIMQLASNPVIQRTNISYFISDEVVQSRTVQFRLYNSVGSLVRTIENAGISSGWNQQLLNVSDLSDGVYSLEFQPGATRQFQQLLILH
jgi:hypothetical protein